MMIMTRILVLLLSLLTAGCAGFGTSRPHELPRLGVTESQGAAGGTAVAQTSSASPAPPELVEERPAAAPVPKKEAATPEEKPAASTPPPPVEAPPSAVASPQAVDKSTKTEPPAALPAPKEKPTPSTTKSAAETKPSEDKGHAKKAAEPARTAPDKKKETVATTAAKPEASQLDLNALEKRLKETNAIGVFTKLTLKNQVDDLLGQFRAYYQGKSKMTLAQLRKPYEQLLLKVRALLVEGDPQLASAVMASREAIWDILSDPKKFAKL